ncbi:MAG: glutathione-disulfide reductase [Gammaproteobacteria bacterium]|nr:glutathione-disulfide reductase [Gammaproteobacteria bacterium]
MKTHYDVLCIGGGSGGLAAAQRAAMHGARAAVIESGRLGGTCVNVGCVPKKVMWYAAQVAHTLEDCGGYGFDITVRGHDWAQLKQQRDAYVARLNDIYARNLDRREVQLYRAPASFIDSHTVAAGENEITADHIVIATGGRPRLPVMPGAGLGMVSDDFFDLEHCPRRVAVIGSGYIAVELAGMLAALGAEVRIFVRYEGILRQFDPMLREMLTAEMARNGIRVITESGITELRQAGDQISVDGPGGKPLWTCDKVLWAVGRIPNIEHLGLAATGIELNANNEIITDEFQNTNVPGVYAIGDVSGRAQLTPVAIAAGRRLADRVVGGEADRRLDYDCIPTVVFSHPTIGTVGLTEPQARERWGDDVRVYEASYKPMYDQLTGHDSRAAVKLIVHGTDERIAGCHVFGPGADEMLQGFAVAIKMGATKKDFDDTVAIHPTAAEELVTLT